MPRVKRGTTHVARRNRLYRKAKGFRWGRKNKIRLARVAVTKAGVYAYRDRRNRKRAFRRLWQVRVNAAARLNDTSYSRLVHQLKTAHIELDRKVLADLAANHPEVFTEVIKSANAK